MCFRTKKAHWWLRVPARTGRVAWVSALWTLAWSGRAYSTARPGVEKVRWSILPPGCPSLQIAVSIQTISRGPGPRVMMWWYVMHFFIPVGQNSEVLMESHSYSGTCVAIAHERKTLRAQGRTCIICWLISWLHLLQLLCVAKHFAYVSRPDRVFRIVWFSASFLRFFGADHGDWFLASEIFRAMVSSIFESISSVFWHVVA